MRETKLLTFIGVILFILSATQSVNAQCPGFTITQAANFQNVSCKGGSDGVITVLVDPSGGATTLVAFVQPGPPPTGTMDQITLSGTTVFTDTFTNLAAGMYDVIVTDQLGCMDTIQVTVDEPVDSFLLVFDSIRNADCGDNGYLSVSTSGGWSSPTIFTWDAVGPGGAQLMGYPRSLGFQLVNLGPGTYTATATDAEGCEQTISQTLTGGSVFEVDLSILDGSLPLELGGSIDLLATPNSGGSSITYDWFPKTDLELLSVRGDSVRVQPCEERVYIVLAVDVARQCSDIDSITITLEGEFEPWFPNIFNPTSFNPNNNEFKAFGIGIVEVDLEIFDRKGAIIYETPDSVDFASWNGDLGDSGIGAVAGKYIYVSSVRSICNEIITKTGGLTLIR